MWLELMAFTARFMPSWVEIPTGPPAPVRSWIEVTVMVLGSVVLLATFAEPVLDALDVLPVLAGLDELLDELQAATAIEPAASMAAADTARLYCDRLTGRIESPVI